MKKAGSFILLGIVIYGAVFPPRFTGEDAGFAMARVSVQFEQREGNERV